MPIFQVGDRVMRVQETNAKNVKVGSLGTVVDEEDVWGLIPVRWDKTPPMRGHSCNGKCPAGYGWNVPPCDLDHIRPDAIDEDDYDTAGIATMFDLFRAGQ